MPGRTTQAAGILAVLGIVALVAAPAFAQPAPEPAPPPGMPNMTDPPAESTPPPDRKGETAPLDAPLSEHLKQNEGVIEPPRDIDSKIVRPAPVPDPNTTPVIPPPGSPGGDQTIEPR